MDDVTTIRSATLVRRAKDIPFTQLDDELVAIDAQQGYCYSLNQSASRVWDLIASPVSVSSIRAHLCQEYKVDEQTCLREVIAVLQALRNAGLVRTDDASSG